MWIVLWVGCAWEDENRCFDGWEDSHTASDEDHPPVGECDPGDVFCSVL